MGHQVNFYITPDDALRIEASLRAEHRLVIVEDISKSAVPSVVDTAVMVDDTGQRLFFHLVRWSDLRSVVMKRVEARDEWAVDVLHSPTIEYTRSFFDGRILRRGRIYYVDGYQWPDGSLVRKSAEFREWAALVLKRTKKLLKRRGSDYIGHDAMEWLGSTGGNLVV